MVITKSIEFGDKTLTIETGKLAKQADGAVVVRYGDTIVLVTAVASVDETEFRGFFPLSVEYREKMFSAGRFPGGFLKREGRPSDREILSARLIDRPLRPLFPDNFFFETQIVANVLSMDKENQPDVLAGFGASAALTISNIPFNGPIATVRVAKIDGNFVINPTLTQTEKSTLELVVAGSEDSITMVEGEAKEVPESEILEAIDFAHENIKRLIALQQELVSEINVTKREVAPKEYPEGFLDKVTEMGYEKVKEAIRITEKSARQTALREVRTEISTALEEDYPENKRLVSEILHDIEKKEVRAMILNEQRRLDERGLKDIRPISVEVSPLPRTHGSGLFTRGQTQVMGIITLGSKADEQIIDALEGESSKKYLLHYNFPPFCTGEAKPIRGVSRREVGHGYLAERAIKPVIPGDSFPYTIRIVAEVLESNGSSSMATVCAGSLALMDAGVPVTGTVAGIAMGLIKEGDQVAILSDILGDEDHLGDMDFKVAGTEKGITAVQMDIKIAGISKEIMQEALEQAKEGRAYIAEKMEEVIGAHRPELSQWAPRILKIDIPVDKIGTVIGPGGKMIQSITKRFEVEINIGEDGETTISSPDFDAAEKARDYIQNMLQEPEVGKAYAGVVKRVKDFGCFVEFLPGKEGMVHISELEFDRTNKVSDVVREGDEINVVVTNVGRDGKIALSRKAYLKRQQSKDKQ